MDHANTRALYDYWNGLRKGRDAPYRSEIDPRRISAALETMFILEAVDSDDIRFRLAGTGLCELLGVEPRGMSAGVMMDPLQSAQLMDVAWQVVERPAIAVMRVMGAPRGAEIDGPPRELPRGELLLLPMRSELGRLDRVLGAVNMLGERSASDGPTRLRALGSKLLPIDPSPMMAEDFDMRERAFAEPETPFARREGPPPLTAIEGNPNAESEPRPARAGGHLRLVKR